MSSAITRRDLRSKLNGVTQKQWGVVAERLGLNFDCSSGRGSHCVVRDPKYPDISDARSCIATVQDKLYKEANITIFKHLLEFGIAEDDIWRAFRMLK